jgi:hypothetical protein
MAAKIPYRYREPSNWTLSQEMRGNLQKRPPMRQISVAAWTRKPARELKGLPVHAATGIG